MGYTDAVIDSIPHEVGKDGFDWYYPPCKKCKTPVPTWSYVKGTQYLCKKCREAVKHTKDNKERKLKKAIARIARVTDVAPYKQLSAKLRKGFETPLFFQSTEEIMVALELLRQGIKAYHQVKVSDYRVDFLLPTYKVVLEIDGPIFHSKENQAREEIRDDVIKAKLGKGFEVIHISAENINQNVTKLLPAIEAVLKKRKQKKECS